MSYKEDKQEFLESEARFAEIVNPFVNNIIMARERAILGFDIIVDDDMPDDAQIMFKNEQRRNNNSKRNKT